MDFLRLPKNLRLEECVQFNYFFTEKFNFKNFELKCTNDITVNERIKAEVVREAFRRLESSRNKTNADGLKKAFEQSQNCIRSHLELNQYKTFLESQFYKSGSHLPPIDEDKVLVHLPGPYPFTLFLSR